MLGPSRSELQRPLTVRRAKAQDAPAIAKVYVDTWREAYRGQLPEDYLGTYLQRLRAPLAPPSWRVAAFVAEMDDRVIGIASGGRSRRQALAGRQIYMLYVHPDQHGAGIGRALFDACHFELARRRYAGTLVWVLASNPARGFYEHLGGERVAENTLEIGGSRVLGSYLWRD
ncbi:MAG: GNAT family N-acetyltransferase [Geminicoccaceae bacterium]